jgi:predicted ester cyclase
MFSIRHFVGPLALLCVASGCASEAGDSSNPADPQAAASSQPEAADVAAHIEIVKERIAASNAQDWDTWQGLHTAGAVRTAPGLPGPVEGSAAMRASIEELFTTFPDYHLELVEAFGEGDQLVARIHTRATMNGPLQLGETLVPATGKGFEQDWLALLVFEDNKIAAIDEFYDNYEILVQLGLSQ